MSGRGVPVIDISDLRDAATLAALDAACREWGFFQIVNHGMHAATADRLMRAMRAFFAAPSTDKRTISRTADNPWGFFDRELTKNTRDWKEIYDYGPTHGEAMRPQWPRWMPEFRPALVEFYAACEKIAFDLLSAISINLGLPADHLAAGFRPTHTSYLRLNYYPTCPTPESPADVSTPRTGHLAINHHTDSGAITVLLQDQQPGLEVYRRSAWHLVEPMRDALVVNIGDIVQVWSNDRYAAPLHRVLANAAAERFSAPFFFNPAYNAIYAPLPTTVDATHGPRYRSINWGEFRDKRSAGDYADQGEEVQISHYRL
jgi:isopenicillin N synthase-like dioxygenase